MYFLNNAVFTIERRQTKEKMVLNQKFGERGLFYRLDTRCCTRTTGHRGDLR